MCIDLKEVLSFLKETLPLIGSLGGIILGGWIVSRQNRYNNEQAFKERQLRDFYGPLYAMHLELKLIGEMREKVQGRGMTINGRKSHNAPALLGA
jgi:hypothetical protein